MVLSYILPFMKEFLDYFYMIDLTGWEILYFTGLNQHVFNYKRYQFYVGGIT